MRRFSPIYILFFTLMYVSFCGFEQAQSRSVPDKFNRRSFDSIIHLALQNYIDPGSVKLSRTYVGASEAALQSMPYPLMLYPRNFYENRETIQKAERMIPGSPVYISSDDPFVILVPDYAELEKKAESREKSEKNRRKNMSPAEKLQELEKTRKEYFEETKLIEKEWDRTGFSRNDFDRIVTWIEQNREKYTKLPSTFKGSDPFKDNPFGMNHVYFAAVNGFLQSMDPHSSVLDMESWDKIRSESEDSSFEGIGAMLRGGGSQDVIVETPLANSPALKAGLRAGDIIRRVNSKAIEGLPLSEVVRLIRGPRDTVVELEVERTTQGGDIHSIKITRNVIKQLAVTSYMYPNSKYGVIKISSFLYQENSTAEAVKNEYDKLIKANGELEGLVIDLRDNPGGFLDEAVNVAGLFLPNKSVVVQTKGKGSSLDVRYSKNGKMIKGFPVIVLINSNSASASEIVASALQDHNKALILGERSFGKASVQEMRSHGDVILKLTTQRYYAPKGYTIQVAGVHPDIEVSDELENTFPPRYREEDMWKHLPELQIRKVPFSRKRWIEKLKSSVGENASAEEFIKKHKEDAEKPDFMMIRAVSYFKALKQFPAN